MGSRTPNLMKLRMRGLTPKPKRVVRVGDDHIFSALGSGACAEDFTCGVFTDSMAMAVSIQKMSEGLPTTELVRPNAELDVDLCQQNTLSSSCHPSCESVQPCLTGARFVGECLSDTNSFDSVDTCVGMYEHFGARAHARWHVRSCMLSLVAICGSRCSNLPLGTDHCDLS